MARAQSPAEVAQLIVRFLEGKSLYPQEWNDFVDCSHPDPTVEAFRRRCDELNPLVNSPDPQDLKALDELRSIVEKLLSVPA